MTGGSRVMREGKSRTVKGCAGLLWALALAGCATGINEDMIWLKTLPAFEKYERVRRVAVIPFSEYYVTGGEKVIMGVPHRITRDNSKVAGDIFTQELQARAAYKIIPPEKVAEFFKKRREKVYGMLPSKEVQRVGGLLKADAIVMGQVDDFSVYKYRMYENARVALQLRMTDKVTGETIWRGSVRLDQEGKPHEVARRGISLILDQLASKSASLRSREDKAHKIINR